MDILSDENCHGQAKSILRAIERIGWQELVPIRLLAFEQTELLRGSDDETVWQFCQTNGYLLLTGNRTTKDGDDSLEIVLRRSVTERSLPVLTIGKLKRISTDPTYCEKCAESLVTIVWELIYEGKHRGTPRLYLPLPVS